MISLLGFQIESDPFVLVVFLLSVFLETSIIPFLCCFPIIFTSLPPYVVLLIPLHLACQDSPASSVAFQAKMRLLN